MKKKHKTFKSLNMKGFFKLIITLLICFSCKEQPQQAANDELTVTIKKDVNTVLDNWHKAAAEANFETYFDLMTTDAIFIGTDATENWNYIAFKEFCKPYFERGNAWSFESVDRNIFISEDKKIAWFDELLDTKMKLCRGSGVLKKENDNWKIAHYVLSIAVPNENVGELIEIKKNTDSLLTLIIKQNNPY